MSQLVQLIDGQWLAGEGKPFESRDPAKNEVIWQGGAASAAQVDAAVKAALQQALQDYAGTVVVVCHEQAFVADWPDRVLDIHSLAATGSVSHA